MINKLYLPLNEKPVLIETPFPKFTSNLLLHKLENKQKLRPLLQQDLVPTVQEPETTDLEKNVLETLRNSKVDAPASRDATYTELPKLEIDDEENSCEENEPAEVSDIESEKSSVHELQPEKITSVPTTELIEEYEEEEEQAVPVQQPSSTEERTDLLWSLKKLKRYHDVKSFPHYDEYTPTQELKRILKEVKREAILDENVNQTKQYLTMMWFGLEKVCTEYLSIDLSGFTAYETQNLNEYQKVLVELGERSYLNWSEGFPPELKLIYLMLTHAALFHVKKNTSLPDVMGLFDSKKQSGEMRGPSKLF